MARPFEPVLGHLPNPLVIGLVGRSMGVLIGALIGAAIKGLGVTSLPLSNLVFVNVDLAVLLDPVAKPMENVLVGVRRYARAEPIVPAMNAADQILTLDLSVREQRTAVQTTPIKDRDLVFVRPTDYHEIDIGDQRVGGCGRIELSECGYAHLVHVASSFFLRILTNKSGHNAVATRIIRIRNVIGDPIAPGSNLAAPLAAKKTPNSSPTATYSARTGIIKDTTWIPPSELDHSHLVPNHA